jgi:formate dehydrogenase iron-sulfur subunit
VSIGDGVASPNQARHDYAARGVTVGFLTDPTVCIGCKACEVACKEWNGVPADGFLFSGDSYDHTGQLSGSTWRHVKFLEVDQALRPQEGHFGSPSQPEAAGLCAGRGGGEGTAEPPFTWLFVSDVCKHCEVAGCLEACPTGAILRTELDTIYVQDDVCNGCGYCVVGCPFGVIDRRPEPLDGAGGAFKCTFCYDRQSDGLTPACAKVCPTESILFGPLDELRERGAARVRELEARGYHRPALYDPRETSVRGVHALFILLGDPEPYGLPPRPESPTVHLESAWLSAFLCAVAALALTFGAFAIF